MWYETKEYGAFNNPSYLNIKKISNNKALMDLYITKTANFDNYEANINGNSGTFEAKSDNGSSKDGQAPKINGNIKFSNNTVTITILNSNITDINSGDEYRFRYHRNNSKIENYKGTWYESETHSSDKDPNTLSIKNIDNNKIVFDLYITKTANFNNVTVYISDDFGSFEAVSNNGIPKDNGKSKIKGYLDFNNNTIKLMIGLSNVLGIESGAEYTFEYKK